MSRTVVWRHEIGSKDAAAWTVKAGQEVRITDVEGRQVGDLVLLNQANLRDQLSISWTRTRNLRDLADYVPKLGLGLGDSIWSSGFNVLATVTEDTPAQPAVHDLYGRMCNRAMYEMYGVTPQDGCFELLIRALEPHGVAPEEIPDPIGVFMHTVPDPEAGVMRLLEPVSRAGDRFSIRAEMDLLCAMSTCPMDVIAPTNGWSTTPMLVEVLDG